MAKTLREIGTEWLKAHGCDGLCNPALECGCKLTDLMPCGEPSQDECVAARKGKPPEGAGSECDFWMVPADEVPQ